MPKEYFCLQVGVSIVNRVLIVGAYGYLDFIMGRPHKNRPRRGSKVVNDRRV